MSSRLGGCGREVPVRKGLCRSYFTCDSHHLCRDCKIYLHEAQGKALGLKQDGNKTSLPQSAVPLTSDSRNRDSSLMMNFMQKLVGNLVDRENRIGKLEQKLKAQRQHQPGQITRMLKRDGLLFGEYAMDPEEALTSKATTVNIIGNDLGSGSLSVYLTPEAPANTPGNWQHPYGCQVPHQAIPMGRVSSNSSRRQIASHNAAYHDAHSVSSNRPYYTADTRSGSHDNNQSIHEDVQGLQREGSRESPEPREEISKLQSHGHELINSATRNRSSLMNMEARIQELEEEINGLGIHLKKSDRYTSGVASEQKTQGERLDDLRWHVDGKIIGFERLASSMGTRLGDDFNKRVEEICEALRGGWNGCAGDAPHTTTRKPTSKHKRRTSEETSRRKERRRRLDPRSPRP